jgi:hypothetical protein
MELRGEKDYPLKKMDWKSRVIMVGKFLMVCPEMLNWRLTEGIIHLLGGNPGGASPYPVEHVVLKCREPDIMGMGGPQFLHDKGKF